MSKNPGPLSKLYNAIIKSVDPFVPQILQPLWTSPAGPKTVFFWGPSIKWVMVIAGLGDTIHRPAQNISINQCASLAGASLIYTRYSMVITPKNYIMLSVNAAIFMIQSFLIGKHLLWRDDSTQTTEHEHSEFPFHSTDW
ncbi:hypothetical protein KR054_005491 [Drosophila jambulina]|nr:hypothetical protein KR054_005491 [Drosophila jambulina]